MGNFYNIILKGDYLINSEERKGIIETINKEKKDYKKITFFNTAKRSLEVESPYNQTGRKIISSSFVYGIGFGKFFIPKLPSITEEYKFGSDNYYLELVSTAFTDSVKNVDFEKSFNSFYYKVLFNEKIEEKDFDFIKFFFKNPEKFNVYDFEFFKLSILPALFQSLISDISNDILNYSNGSKTFSYSADNFDKIFEKIESSLNVFTKKLEQIPFNKFKYTKEVNEAVKYEKLKIFTYIFNQCFFNPSQTNIPREAIGKFISNFMKSYNLSMDDISEARFQGCPIIVHLIKNGLYEDFINVFTRLSPNKQMDLMFSLNGDKFDLLLNKKDDGFWYCDYIENKKLNSVKLDSSEKISSLYAYMQRNQANFVSQFMEYAYSKNISEDSKKNIINFVKTQIKKLDKLKDENLELYQKYCLTFSFYQDPITKEVVILDKLREFLNDELKNDPKLKECLDNIELTNKNSIEGKTTTYEKSIDSIEIESIVNESQFPEICTYYNIAPTIFEKNPPIVDVELSNGDFAKVEKLSREFFKQEDIISNKNIEGSLDCLNTMSDNLFNSARKKVKYSKNTISRENYLAITSCLSDITRKRAFAEELIKNPGTTDVNEVMEKVNVDNLSSDFRTFCPLGIGFIGEIESGLVVDEKGKKSKKLTFLITGTSEDCIPANKFDKYLNHKIEINGFPPESDFVNFLGDFRQKGLEEALLLEFKNRKKVDFNLYNSTGEVLNEKSLIRKDFLTRLNSVSIKTVDINENIMG